MSETRKEKAGRLVMQYGVAAGGLGKTVHRDKYKELKVELLAFILETPDAALTPQQSNAVAAAVRLAMGHSQGLTDDELQWLVYLSTNHTTTPDIPTPEPVAVEDIVPGWYWVTTPNYQALVRAFEFDVMFISGEQWNHGGLRLSEAPTEAAFYRAPSPAALMRMCREVVTAEEVPTIAPGNVQISPAEVESVRYAADVYCRINRGIVVTRLGDDMGDTQKIQQHLDAIVDAGSNKEVPPVIDPLAAFRGKQQNVAGFNGTLEEYTELAHRLVTEHEAKRKGEPPVFTSPTHAEIKASLNESAARIYAARVTPPAVEVALAVLDRASCPQSLRNTAFRTIEGYLLPVYEQHAPEGDGQDAAEPAAIETCGECGNYNRISFSGGKCNARDGMGTTMHSSFGGECELATPKVVVETCGQCDNYSDPPKGSDAWGECQATTTNVRANPLYPAKDCPHATPKAKVAT